jgi:hypothetical protein
MMGAIGFVGRLQLFVDEHCGFGDEGDASIDLRADSFHSLRSDSRLALLLRSLELQEELLHLLHFPFHQPSGNPHALSI